MKVYIKNKLISLGGSSEVLNEQNQTIFKVKGKIFSPTKQKKMYDMEGNLLYVIRNKFWKFIANKVFVFDAEKTLVATIKKGKWSYNSDFEIEDTPDEMKIDGKFFSRKSKILKNEETVATINREITFIKDAFCLEADEKDIPFFTALVVAFDNMKDKIEKEK